MIVSGVAATPRSALQGHVLLAGAVDVTQRGVPLCLEHGRQIGEVTRMQYFGHDLYVIAETDDEAALQLDYFSIAGKPIEREQRGAVWHVSKLQCTEISLVKVPQNDRCVVFERKASDPFRALYKTRARELDLFKQAFGALAKGLQLMAR